VPGDFRIGPDSGQGRSVRYLQRSDSQPLGFNLHSKFASGKSKCHRAESAQARIQAAQKRDKPPAHNTIADPGQPVRLAGPGLYRYYSNRLDSPAMTSGELGWWEGERAGEQDSCRLPQSKETLAQSNLIGTGTWDNSTSSGSSSLGISKTTCPLTDFSGSKSSKAPDPPRFSTSSCVEGLGAYSLE